MLKMKIFQIPLLKLMSKVNAKLDIQEFYVMNVIQIMEKLELMNVVNALNH